MTCLEQWGYEPHTIETATKRAECVRRDLKELTKLYKNTALVTHRGFVAFLVQGSRFDVCGTPPSSIQRRLFSILVNYSSLEIRSYRFPEDGEVEGLRHSLNIDTQGLQDLSHCIGARPGDCRRDHKGRFRTKLAPSAER